MLVSTGRTVQVQNLLGGLDTVQITEVKGHADEGMVLDGRVREVDRLGNDAADEAADFGRGTLLFLTFRAVSIMMVGMELLLILWCVLSPRGVGWFMRFGTGLFCLGHLVFGIRNGLMFLHLLSVVRTLLTCPVPLVSCINGLLF